MIIEQIELLEGMTDLRLLPVETLPEGPVKGTIVNHAGSLKRFCGVAWSVCSCSVEMSNKITTWLLSDADNASEVGILQLDGSYFTVNNRGNVTKKNSVAVLQWRIDLDHLDSPKAIATDGTSIYVCGTGLAGEGPAEAVLTKLDADSGALIWTKTLQNPERTTAFHHMTFDGTDIVLCGKANITTGTNNRGRMLVAKYTTDGTLIYQKFYGDADLETTGYNITPADITAIGTDVYICGFSLGGNPVWKGFVLKIDVNGTKTWMKQLGNIVGGWKGITNDGADVYVSGVQLGSNLALWAKYTADGTLVYQHKAVTGSESISMRQNAHFDGHIYSVGGCDSQAYKGMLLKTNAATGAVVYVKCTEFDNAPATPQTIHVDIDICPIGNIYIASQSRVTPGSTLLSNMEVLNIDDGASMVDGSTNPLLNFFDMTFVSESSTQTEVAEADVFLSGDLVTTSNNVVPSTSVLLLTDPDTTITY